MATRRSSTSKSEEIASYLRERILSGELRPGDRILQEEVAAILGVSRQPIRSALLKLESWGLVRLVPSSGAWVTGLTLEECVLSYKMRERLEPLLLTESLSRASDEYISDIEEHARHVTEATTVDEFISRDRSFHLLTYALNSDGALKDFVLKLWDTTQHYRRAFVVLTWDKSLDDTWSEHSLLVGAIRSRDFETAETILRIHIRRTRVHLSSFPEIFAPKSN